MEQLVQDKTFEKNNFAQEPLAKGEYEHCIFNNCDFSGADLKEVIFFECEFTGCNLSNALLTKTAFREIKFISCKMLGMAFDSCNPFGLAISIDSCILNHSSFYGVKLKKTIFKNTSLHEVDFTDCDLGSSVFDNCDLAGSRFDNTILEKADMRTSFNYSIDPDKNRIKKARFSLPAVTGLLDKYDIQID